MDGPLSLNICCNHKVFNSKVLYLLQILKSDHCIKKRNVLNRMTLSIQKGNVHTTFI